MARGWGFQAILNAEGADKGERAETLALFPSGCLRLSNAYGSAGCTIRQQRKELQDTVQ